ncbi:MAG: AraC family transcriptional regulator [Oscillospiraceae bacterium]
MDKSTEMPLKSDMQELVRHGSEEFPIQYYVNSFVPGDNSSVPLHWHPRPEFFTVRNGRVKARVGSTEITLESGEGLFLNANSLHSYACGGDELCLCPDIVFSEELIAPLNSAINRLYIAPVILNEKLPFIHLQNKVNWQAEVLYRLDEVFSLLSRYGKTGIYGEPAAIQFRHSGMESACFEMEVQRAMNGIWQLIFTHMEECEIPLIVKNEHALQIRMQKMLSFINSNYNKEISLNDIAQSASISKSEASRCFQSYLGTSPVNYLLNYRIQKAMQLLRTSEMTVEAISLECCFGSSAYFCKLFRSRTGMTPKQYRNSK